MPKKYIVILKRIFRLWFVYLVLIILLIAIWFLVVAIVLTAIALSLFFLSYVLKFYFKKRIEKFIKDFYRIEDKTVARELKRPLRDIQDKMYSISKNQENKKWLIVFLNKQYIFYHEQTIKAFKELYYKGFSDKEILEKLAENEIKTRAEIKAIEETLIKSERLDERDISVKEHLDKQRFEKI